VNLKALYKLSYGLYIVNSRKGDRLNGQIANTVVQITSEPPTIAASINKSNLTHEFITASKVLAVSVLSQDTPLSFIGHFGFNSGKDIDKFEGINRNYRTIPSGDTKAFTNVLRSSRGGAIWYEIHAREDFVPVIFIIFN